MNRRQALVAFLAVGAMGKDAIAQGQALIAVVSSGAEEELRRNVGAFTEGLRELGQVHGRTYSLQAQAYGGEPKTLSPLLRDLLAKKPDVLVVGGLTVVQAAKQATSSTPIVVANASDLLAARVVPSYTRPGGNLTGLTTLTDVMMAKRLEVLAEAVPRARKVVLLQNPVHGLAKSIEARTREVAARLRIDLTTVLVNDLQQLEAALDELGAARVQAVLVSPNALFSRHMSMLIERALRQKVFVVHWLPSAAEKGALLVQGVDTAKQYRRAASYVDRILRGARPGDLPIEQVTSDELVINLKTARALGIKISQPVLLRANRVIQ